MYKNGTVIGHTINYSVWEMSRLHVPYERICDTEIDTERFNESVFYSSKKLIRNGV